MGDQVTRVLMLCSGVGRENRGIETFFADAYVGLKDTRGLDINLGIGAGTLGLGQEHITSLSRMSGFTKAIGKLVGRDGYTIEQMSSIPSVLAKIRRVKPHVVFTSEANLAMRLRQLRSLTSIPYRLMYSNGAPIRGPFSWADYVHQVTPTYRDLAIADGDDPARHLLVPYGFTVPDASPDRSLARRKEARRALGLPEDRSIVLSVGWIARRHKRMDYVADEIARLPEPRPFLAMIGSMDDGSTEVIAEAQSKLGESGVVARSVPPSEVSTWYAAADVFVLGSLAEGFGRVYMEALSLGVPVFCHDYLVGRFVNGTEAAYGDFSTAGALAALLEQRKELFAEDPVGDRRRWEYARDNFGWRALAPKYQEMFQSAAEGARRA